MALIIGLIILGVLLISAEVLVPGGILGILGMMSFVGACVLGYRDYGSGTAIVIFITGLLIVSVTLFLEFRYLPKTKMGKKLFLQATSGQRKKSATADASLVGKTGQAITPLAPTGLVTIADRQYEAFSQDGFLARGTPITVKGYDNFRLIVTKK